ncbi:hypothetical protein B0J14DRAFT_621330 [Halenospora varia]|nr:hypothetical protein B0J14DRAFT_621330 [Halenospora varia]
MPSNKDRLYVALYARGGMSLIPGKEDTVVALIVGPIKEAENRRGMRYHAKERMGTQGQLEWYFNGQDVLDNKRLESMLRQVPIKQGEPRWNCVIWVKEALEALGADGKALGTGDKKNEHRFDGKGNFDMSKPATYSLLDGEEMIP